MYNEKEKSTRFVAVFLYRQKNFLIARKLMPDPDRPRRRSSNAKGNKRKRNETMEQRKKRLEKELRAVQRELAEEEEAEDDVKPRVSAEVGSEVDELDEMDELEEEPVGGGEESDNDVEIAEPPRKQPVYLDISDDEDGDIQEGPPRNQTLFLDVSDDNSDDDDAY